MSTHERIINAWLFLLGSLILVLGLVSTAHCTSTGPANSLGVVIEHENPNAYILGTILGGTVMKDANDKWATSIRFKPFGTYMLYEESVLFCGDRVDDFGNVAGVIVVTYRKTAHQLYRGIACHELVSVSQAVGGKK